MSLGTTVTIEPNDKYREVIRGELPGGNEVPETEVEYQEAAEHNDAANAFIEFTEKAAEATEEYVDEDDDIPVVTWDDISVSSDPDLVTKIATYFDGVSSDEPLELIRSKLRLLDVDVYIDAQLAATAERKKL